METNLPDLLSRAEQADATAADELFALLYGELRRRAEHHLQRGGGGLTLGTTTLVTMPTQGSGGILMGMCRDLRVLSDIEIAGCPSGLRVPPIISVF